MGGEGGMDVGVWRDGGYQTVATYTVSVVCSLWIHLP